MRIEEHLFPVSLAATKESLATPYATSGGSRPLILGLKRIEQNSFWGTCQIGMYESTLPS